MRTLNILCVVTSLLVLDSICSSSVFAQGGGENISFFRQPRFNDGEPVDEVVVRASASVLDRGSLNRDGEPKESVGSDSASATNMANIDRDESEFFSGSGTSRVTGYAFPPRSVTAYSPNLAIGASGSSTLEADEGLLAGASGSASGRIDLNFNTNSGFATATPANQLATMDVIVHFLVHTNDPDIGGGVSVGGDARVGDTNLTLNRWDDGLYAVAGNLASTNEQFTNYLGHDYLAVSAGGVNALVATRQAVRITGETIRASVSSTAHASSSSDFRYVQQSNTVEWYNGQSAQAQSNVSLFFFARDYSPTDGVPPETPVVILVETNPGDNQETLGPIAFGTGSAIAVAQLDSIEIALADADGNTPSADDSQFEIEIVDNGDQDTVIATLDADSPEVTHDAVTGREVIDLSSLNLPPGLYTVDIGSGFSQQYYVSKLGDINRDTEITNHDIQPFIEIVFEGGEYKYEADMNQDGFVDNRDISLFAAALLGN